MKIRVREHLGELAKKIQNKNGVIALAVMVLLVSSIVTPFNFSFFQPISAFPVQTSLDISPSSHDFDNVQVSSSSSAFTFTITNTGDPAYVIVTGLSGADNGQFFISNDNCVGPTLAGGANCTVDVSFAPGTTGLKSASLDVSSVNSNVASASLTGTGTPADAIAPDTTITSAPSNPSNDPTPTFEFSANEPSTFECSLDGASFENCTSPKDLTFLSDGTDDGSHTFEVRATDTAGNPDASPASYTWTLDTVAPDTIIDSNPANPSNNPNPSFTFSSPDGGISFECKLDAASFAACSSPTPYSGLLDGSHTFEVKATDAAGNTDPTPASFTWTLDTVAPQTSITSAPSNPSNDPTPTFEFSANEPSTFECSVDGGTAYSCSTGETLSFDSSGVGADDGSHTFSVAATDTAGNPDTTPDSYIWTLDTVAPISIIISAHGCPNPECDPMGTELTAPGYFTGYTSVKFEFSASDALSGVNHLECKLDLGTYALCTSPRQENDLSPGTHTFKVIAVDNAGNTEATATLTFTIDVEPPTTAASVIEGTLNTDTGWYISKPVRVSLSATDNPTSPAGAASGVASTVFRINGGDFASYTGPIANRDEGTTTITYKSTDNVGNEEIPPTPLVLMIDTVAPTASFTYPPPNEHFSTFETAVPISVDATDATSGVGSVEIRVDGVSIGPVTGPTGSIYSASWDKSAVITDGPHAITAIITDVAGNSFTIEMTIHVKAPTITIDVERCLTPDAQPCFVENEDATTSPTNSPRWRLDTKNLDVTGNPVTNVGTFKIKVDWGFAGATPTVIDLTNPATRNVDQPFSSVQGTEMVGTTPIPLTYPKPLTAADNSRTITVSLIEILEGGSERPLATTPLSVEIRAHTPGITMQLTNPPLDAGATPQVVAKVRVTAQGDVQDIDGERVGTSIVKPKPLDRAKITFEGTGSILSEGFGLRPVFTEPLSVYCPVPSGETECNITVDSDNNVVAKVGYKFVLPAGTKSVKVLGGPGQQFKLIATHAQTDAVIEKSTVDYGPDLASDIQIDANTDPDTGSQFDLKDVTVECIGFETDCNPASTDSISIVRLKSFDFSTPVTEFIREYTFQSGTYMSTATTTELQVGVGQYFSTGQSTSEISTVDGAPFDIRAHYNNDETDLDFDVAYSEGVAGPVVYQTLANTMGLGEDSYTANAFTFNLIDLSALPFGADDDGDGVPTATESTGVITATFGASVGTYTLDYSLGMASAGLWGSGVITTPDRTNNKDMWVYLQYMEDHRPPQAAIDAVVTSFFSKQIYLHILDGGIPDLGKVGAIKITHRDSIDLWTGIGQYTNYQDIKYRNFGIYNLGGSGTPPVGGTLLGTGNANLKAMLLAVRYCLVGHNFGPGTSGISGLAELQGSNCAISLGTGKAKASVTYTDVDGVRKSPSSWSVGTANDYAGTMNHEFSHMAGLPHGDVDSTSCKPTIFGNENYALQFEFYNDQAGTKYGFMTTAQGWKVQTSPARVANVMEYGLDETKGLLLQNGLRLNPAQPVIWGYGLPSDGTGATRTGTGVTRFTINPTPAGGGTGTNGAIDWNNNGAATGPTLGIQLASGSADASLLTIGGSTTLRTVKIVGLKVTSTGGSSATPALGSATYEFSIRFPSDQTGLSISDVLVGGASPAVNPDTTKLSVVDRNPTTFSIGANKAKIFPAESPASPATPRIWTVVVTVPLKGITTTMTTATDIGDITVKINVPSGAAIANAWTLQGSQVNTIVNNLSTATARSFTVGGTPSTGAINVLVAKPAVGGAAVPSTAKIPVTYMATVKFKSSSTGAAINPGTITPSISLGTTGSGIVADIPSSSILVSSSGANNEYRTISWKAQFYESATSTAYRSLSPMTVSFTTSTGIVMDSITTGATSPSPTASPTYEYVTTSAQMNVMYNAKFFPDIGGCNTVNYGVLTGGDSGAIMRAGLNKFIVGRSSLGGQFAPVVEHPDINAEIAAKLGILASQYSDVLAPVLPSTSPSFPATFPSTFTLPVKFVLADNTGSPTTALSAQLETARYLGGTSFDTVRNQGSFTTQDRDYVYSVFEDDAVGSGDIIFKRSIVKSVTPTFENSLTNLSNDKSASTLPAMASSDTVIVVVWQSGATGGSQSIMMRASYDGGTTWVPAKQISPNGVNAQEPKVTISGDGRTVLVSYQNFGAKTIEMKKSINSGFTFSAPLTLSNPGMKAKSQSLAPSYDGKYIFSAWTEVSSTEPAKLAFKYSSNGGSTFSTSQYLSNPTTGSSVPVLSTTADGRLVFVEWIDTGAAKKLFIRQSVNFGVDFDPIVQITPNSMSPKDHDFSTTNGGEKLVSVWTNGSTNQVHYSVAKLGPDGRSYVFTGPFALSGPVNSNNQPFVALSATGDRAYFTWTQTRSSTSSVVLKSGSFNTTTGGYNLQTSAITVNSGKSNSPIVGYAPVIEYIKNLPLTASSLGETPTGQQWALKIYVTSPSGEQVLLWKANPNYSSLFRVS